MKEKLWWESNWVRPILCKLNSLKFQTSPYWTTGRTCLLYQFRSKVYFSFVSSQMPDKRTTRRNSASASATHTSEKRSERQLLLRASLQGRCRRRLDGLCFSLFTVSKLVEFPCLSVNELLRHSSSRFCRLIALSATATRGKIEGRILLRAGAGSDPGLATSGVIRLSSGLHGGNVRGGIPKRGVTVVSGRSPRRPITRPA